MMREILYYPIDGESYRLQRPPKKLIATSVAPAFGIRWGAQVIRMVTSERLR